MYVYHLSIQVSNEKNWFFTVFSWILLPRYVGIMIDFWGSLFFTTMSHWKVLGRFFLLLGGESSQSKTRWWEAPCLSNPVLIRMAPLGPLVQCNYQPCSMGEKNMFSGWWQLKDFWNFHPYLGKIPILTNIFQRGWFNHQLVFLDTTWLFDAWGGWYLGVFFY